MSNFIDEQAELSAGDESDRSETSEPVAKRPKKQKKKKHQQISSDEEEDEADDDDRAREEMRGFVVDDEEEEGEEGAQAGDDESSKGDVSEGSDDLLDDDLELLNENTGEQSKRGRVEISDDEDDRERIKDQLFGRTTYAEEGNERPQYTQEYDENESRSESEQSEDPFIVDDRDRERKQHRRKSKKHEYSDQVLDEAKDIFGVEDLEEFYEDEEALEEEMEEGEEGIRPIGRPRGAKVTLLDTIEPSELEKGFVRAEDKKIICEDRPERFQIRKIAVTEIDDHDLTLEAHWIHEYAFKAQPLSQQSNIGLSILNVPGKEPHEMQTAEFEASDKIREAIRFIRNQLFEVPFIAFYRKEYVESSLLIPDLWKVYQFDEKWCRLQNRKAKILELLKRVQKYMTESELDETTNMRKITEKDFKEVIGVQTNEELSDVYSHFQLYYSNVMNRVHEWEKITSNEQADSEITSRFKLSGRSDKYQLCIQCGLAPMADSFGLTAEEFAENFTEYVKHDVRQIQKEPNDEAKEYITETFLTPEKVVQGAIYVLAQRFSREPAVRKKLRQIYRQNLLLSINPTKKGRNEIDESHWLWGQHYIKEKPVFELKDDEYLKYNKAKNDDLIEIHLEVGREPSAEVNCLMAALTKDPIFSREEYYYVSEDWNKLRVEVLRVCVDDILIPVFHREAHEKLLEEARDCVIRKASQRLNKLIETEAYKPTFSYEGEEDDIPDTGIRIMAICYSSDRAEASFAVVIDENGIILDHQRLVNFTKRVNTRFADDFTMLKKADMKLLFQLIQRRQPHLIVLNGENMDAMRLADDVRIMMKNEYMERNFPIEIPVEITNCDAAKVYMNSRIAMQEFVEFPPLLRQAVSLARFALDPLIEICHLCNTEDDILYMKFHPLQNEVSKQDLLFALQLECINRVNEVGVDINRCLEFPHTAGLLQFVCGLGPRKASHLLKILKQNDNLLESRTKLVTFCRMGPKVFMNAAGFIKIDTAKIAERTDSYVEVLDGSRVHPETYEWARKMAVDALELDDTVDQTVALEEILKAPDKLKELDLDAFAEELTRQGFGNKSITLYDIRAELNYRYKDLRLPHMAASSDELAQMLLNEDTSNIEGKLIIGQILNVGYKKHKDNEAKLNPRFNNETSTWICPYCKRDFKEPNDVGHHLGEFGGGGDCPGIAIGFRVKLDNGLPGFVHMKEISDKSDKILDPSKLFKPGQNQYFRVIKFQTDRMECQLSCKSSILKREEMQEFDKYFDNARYQEDNAAEEKARKEKQEKKNMNSRVTSHPCFHNVTFKDAEKMLRKMDLGEAIIRPSGKSPNHLTVTWKVADDIFQHIQVEERDKQRIFEIGKKLFINGEEFEDLDEIVARHIQPMTTYVRDIMSYKYYLDTVASESAKPIEEALRKEKQKAPHRIPYCITASKKYPGKFVISFLAQSKVRNEYMTVTPEGIRFRKKMFVGTEDMINWFKMNFTQRPA